MKITPRSTLSRLVALAATVGAIAVVAPAAAFADTYCVTPSACEHPQTTLQAALTAAGTHAGADTLQLAAATYAQNSLTYSGAEPLEIDGVSRTATVITAGASPPASTAVLAASGPVTLRHLGIVLPASSGPLGFQATGLGPETVDDIAVTAAGTPNDPDGLQLSTDATVTNVSITLPTGGDCIFTGGQATLDHVTTSGCSTSLSAQGGAVEVHASELDGATTPAVTAGAGAAMTLDDTIIKPQAGATSLLVTSYSSYRTALTARHVTIVQSGGTSLDAENNSTAAASTADVTVTDSILRGATNRLVRNASGGPTGGTANITVDHTDEQNGTVPTDNGPGARTATSIVDVDPGFVSATDLHLTAASPLLDLEHAALAAGEPATDLDGNPRVIHGASDYGAYELTQAPVVSAPTVSAVGTTTATIASTIDPGGLQTLSFVDYGTTTAYTTALALPTIPATGVAQTQALQLTGLQPATTYHVRVNSTNARGTVPGPDVAFTTAAAPPPPIKPTPKTKHPTLGKLKITPGHRVTKHALTLAFTVTAPAGATLPTTVKVSITHPVGGRRSKAGTCSTTAHKGKSCSVTKTVWSASKKITRAGAARLTVPSKPSGHALKPGNYTLKATLAGKTTTLHFTVASH